nr:pentatricopeptide repeat-containing protein At1g11710, mitochondrial [Ipomoea batatas]GME02587.1 pentatricopeptide repeat-containing protein At1g11710, mitochondrial [Ipomoea batatas]
MKEKPHGLELQVVGTEGCGRILGNHIVVRRYCFLNVLIQVLNYAAYISMGLFSPKRRQLFVRALHLGKQFAHPNTEDVLFRSICVNLRENKWKFMDQICSGLTGSVLSRIFNEFRSSPQVVLEFYKRIGGAKSVLNSLESCCVVIHVMVCCRHFDDALWLMKELMIMKGISPLEILRGLIDSYDVGCGSNAVFDTLVRACTQIRLTDGGYEVIKKLRLEGHMVSVHALNNFLNHLLKLDEVGRFWLVYREMISCGYMGNVYTYNIVIYALCKECKLFEAISVFYRMVKSGIVPNVVSFNMLIDGACRIGELDLAFKLVRNIGIMSGGWVFPNSITYNSLINGCCKLGSLRIAENFLAEMIEMGFEPNVRTYATLVDGYSKNGKLEEAFMMCHNMISMGLLPNSVIYNTLIHQLYMEGDVNGASGLLSDMIKRNILPDNFTYSILAKGLCRNGQMREILKYYKQIVENNLAEDACSHNILIDYLCRSENTLGAQQIFCNAAKGLVDALKGTSVCDVITFNTLLNGYCINGEIEKALHLFCSIRNGGLSINTATYNILINMMCKYGLIQHAKELLSVMITQGISPDAVTYTTLLTSASKISNADEVLQLHDYMVLQGTIPDSDTYKAVVSPLVEANASGFV